MIVKMPKSAEKEKVEETKVEKIEEQEKKTAQKNAENKADD